MTPSCALCQGPATIYCCNDDASLCAACDVKFHSNPLTARHERRAIAPVAVANSAAFEPAETSDDLHVVPQCGPRSPTIGMAPTHMTFIDFGPGPAAPTFGGSRELSISDLLALDDPSLLDFGFDDLLGDNAFNEVPLVPQAFTTAAPVNPFNSLPDAAVPHMVPQMMTASVDEDDEDWAEEAAHATRGAAKRERDVAPVEPELTREERVQRYREKRARRNFRKTIRYQSRKAYAEIRPRIKGRFVSPEEYAAYMAGGKVDDVAVVPSFGIC